MTRKISAMNKKSYFSVVNVTLTTSPEAMAHHQNVAKL